MAVHGVHGHCVVEIGIYIHIDAVLLYCISCQLLFERRCLQRGRAAAAAAAESFRGPRMRTVLVYRIPKKDPLADFHSL